MYTDYSGYRFCFESPITNLGNGPSCKGGGSSSTASDFNQTGGDHVEMYGEPLTQDEINLIDGNIITLGILGYTRYMATLMTNRYFDEGTHNGKADAFRHAYWSSLLTKYKGKDFALNYTTAHENYFGNSMIEMEMDLFNNSAGIDYALKNGRYSYNITWQYSLPVWYDDISLGIIIYKMIENGDLMYITGGELVFTNE